MTLYCATGHSHNAAYLAVSQFQRKAKNQDTLLLLGQIGKGGGDKLIVDIQAAPMRRKYKAVAGMTLCIRHLTHAKMNEMITLRKELTTHEEPLHDCLVRTP